MATVTSLTADRMIAIEEASVVSGEVIGDNLILTTFGGDDIDAGVVRGPQGPIGVGPTGSVMMFAGSSAPTDWLLCDGSAVSRTTYSALFALLSTTYGAGNGTTTFNLPNLKGRIPVGLDSTQTEFDTLGENGGAKTHTLTSAEMPSHTHIQNSHNHTQNSHNHTQDAHAHGLTVAGWGAGSFNSSRFRQDANSPANQWPGTDAATATNQATTATNQAATATNQNTGGGGAHNNLQPYLVMNYIIKT